MKKIILLLFLNILIFKTTAQTLRVQKEFVGYSLTELRALSALKLQTQKTFYCNELDKEGYYAYSTDVVSVDDDLNVLVCTGNIRLKRLANSIKNTFVATTLNMGFSTSFNQPTLGGFDLVSKKNEVRVLLIGSSNVEGAGATSYQNSWANKLEQYLQSKGVVTRNVSIGGTNTQSTLDRFYKDVITWKPTIVIEGTALFNEGLYGGNFDAVETSIKNIGKLQNICNQYGIKLLKAPVLPYTNGSTSKIHGLSVYTSERYDDISIGDGMTNEVNGVIFSGSSAGDGIHVNNSGHDAIYKSVNVYKITHPELDNKVIPIADEGIFVKDTITNQGQFQGLDLVFPEDQKLHSFTIAFQVKNLKGYSSKGLLAFAPAVDACRIRNSGVNFFEMVINNCPDVQSIPTNTDKNINRWHDIVITFNQLQKIAKFYVDGVYYGYRDVTLSTLAQGNGTNILRFGGLTHQTGNEALGHSFKNIYVYNAPLSEDICKNFYKQQIRRRSLILASPLSEIVPYGSKFTNYACSPLALVNNFPNLRFTQPNQELKLKKTELDSELTNVDEAEGNISYSTTLKKVQYSSGTHWLSLLPSKIYNTFSEIGVLSDTNIRLLIVKVDETNGSKTSTYLYNGNGEIFWIPMTKIN